MPIMFLYRASQHYMKITKAASLWMNRCGVVLLLFVMSLGLLGLGIQYSGPTQYALWVLPLILDQIASYCEMRVMSISMEKII